MSNLVKKKDVIVIDEGKDSIFYEYKLPFKNASLGVSQINGRYPESGYDIDEVVEASWYVESGNGIVCIQEEEQEIAQGDMIHVPAGERYWIKGDKLKLVVCSSPIWYPEQHKHIEE